MNLVFLGTPDFAVPSLIALHDAPHRILAVVTRPDRPAGRGQHLQTSPVKQEALRRGLPVLQPERLDAATVAAVSALAPDIAVVVAYGLILTPEMLRVSARGCVNLHASLLPRYRGAAPVAHAILRGEKVTGVTTLLMDEGIDTGALLMQRETPLGPEETTGEVERRLSILGAELLVGTLAALARGEIQPRAQVIDRETYAPKIHPDAARLDWRNLASDLANRIRAFNPRPGAFTARQRRVVKIWRAVVPAREENPAAAARPGTVLSGSGRLRVACGEGTTLEIREVQLEGRRRVSGEEALHGRWFTAGDEFDGWAGSEEGSGGPPPTGM